MNRAVWSFWSKPFRHNSRTVWPSQRHHLLAWVLSVEAARRHYPQTTLVTDDFGAVMLVDGIGLHFDQVSTELNTLEEAHPEWWGLGKLYAYRSQTEPFVHIDSDCFLWRRLPPRLEHAGVFGQSPETFAYDEPTFYQPGRIVATLDSTKGWVPPELRWFNARHGNWAVNCGILGGSRSEFIRHYADSAIALIEHPANQHAWDLLGNRMEHTVTIEQHLLAACIDYHRSQPRSPHHGITSEHLFTSPEHPYDPERATRAGFTHLIASSKSDPDIAGRLAARVASEYPKYARRCMSYAKAMGDNGGGGSQRGCGGEEGPVHLAHQVATR